MSEQGTKRKTTEGEAPDAPPSPPPSPKRQKLDDDEIKEPPKVAEEVPKDEEDEEDITFISTTRTLARFVMFPFATCAGSTFTFHHSDNKVTQMYNCDADTADKAFAALMARHVAIPRAKEHEGADTELARKCTICKSVFSEQLHLKNNKCLCGGVCNFVALI
jgi:hypothetical protein